MDRSTLTLTDDVGRSLVCHIEMSATLAEITYALLSPVDYPVDIFAWVEDEDEDEEVLELLEDQELNEVFATAQAVLAELNLKLNRSALSLTVAGDLPDVDEDKILILELEDEDGESNDQDEYQLLTTFYHDEQEYLIYTPIDPVLFVVSLQDPEHPQLLTPEEFQAIQPQLQPLFEAQLDNDAAHLDDFE